MGILPNLAAVPSALPKAPALSGATSGLGNVNAVLARAGRIGSMSVPAGWAYATGKPVTALPGGGLSELAATEAVTPAGSGTPGIPGIPGGNGTASGAGGPALWQADNGDGASARGRLTDAQPAGGCGDSGGAGGPDGAGGSAGANLQLSGFFGE